MGNLRSVTCVNADMEVRADSAICRRRRPPRYHWGVLGVANAVHALSAVSHTTRLAHLRGDRCTATRLREPHQRRHAHPQLGNYMTDILGELCERKPQTGIPLARAIFHR